MKTKFPRNVQPVLVEWIDSTGSPGWNNQGKVMAEDYDLNIVSVGILLKKDKTRVTLAMGKSEYQYGDIIQIPLVAVKRIRKLNV